MQVINYNEFYKRTNAAIEDRNARAKEMGYKDYNDYLDSKESSLTYADRNWEFSKDYNNFVKENLTIEDLLNQDRGITTTIFDGKNDLESLMENKDIFNIKEVMKIVKAAYKDAKELDGDELEQLLESGKSIVKEMFNKGVNKEQVRVMLLKEEKAWTQKLLEEAKKQHKSDEAYILKGKNKLRKIYLIKREIDKIKTPYDKLFDISSDIVKAKVQKNQYENSLNPRDSRFVEIESNRINEQEGLLSKKLEEVDPRIVYDVVKDKIESKKLELEIGQIKTGAEITADVERNIESELSEIKTNLKPLMKSVKQEIKENNNEYNV